MRIVQIVRRFGPVGGMERYAWKLSRELAELGHQVTVLCERQHMPMQANGLTVHELGEVRPRPRWLAHLRFSRRVSGWLRQHPQPGTIIHSHERTGVHHVTTFHGPPFAEILRKPVWQRVSPRVTAQLWLERREVCKDNVRVVVPNSRIIATMLADHYPCIGARLTPPITPGVDAAIRRTTRPMPSAEGGTIGFVGVEWQRKGLQTALSIYQSLRQRRPQLQLLIAGPDAQEIRHLLPEDSDGIRCLGRVESAGLYPQLDLLLHPASREPYGMVIAEAMAAGVPVIASDACGASTDIAACNGTTLSVDDPVERWAKACDGWLSTQTEVRYSRPWSDVAQEYLRLYEGLRIDD